MTKSNSESPNGSTPLQSNNKNSNKPQSKPKEKFLSQKTSIPKLPLYKKAKEFTSNKKQPRKTSDKTSNQMQNSNTVRSATSHDNPAKKVKTVTSLNNLKKKEINLPLHSDALSLQPTDSSENKETMSIASDSSGIDTFI